MHTPIQMYIHVLHIDIKTNNLNTYFFQRFFGAIRPC